MLERWRIQNLLFTRDKALRMCEMLCCVCQAVNNCALNCELWTLRDFLPWPANYTQSLTPSLIWNGQNQKWRLTLCGRHRICGRWFIGSSGHPLRAHPSLVHNIGDDSLLASCPLRLMTGSSLTLLGPPGWSLLSLVQNHLIIQHLHCIWHLVAFSFYLHLN